MILSHRMYVQDAVVLLFGHVVVSGTTQATTTTEYYSKFKAQKSTYLVAKT